MKALKANEDYYLLPNGNLVFTEQYLLKRGVCCGNGCYHCPYEYSNVPEPLKTQLFKQKREDGNR